MYGGERSSVVREYCIATGVGAIYGATSTLVGHPFGTAKTKMQAQAGHSPGGMMTAIGRIAKADGPLGFYHGCLHPIWGSAIYRSAQVGISPRCRRIDASSHADERRESPHRTPHAPPPSNLTEMRVCQFAVYGMLYNSDALATPAFRQPAAGTGVELRVPLAGIVGATARMVLEV
jgi:hypothetical protein